MNQIAGFKRDSFQAVEQILNVIESFPRRELNQRNMRPIEQGLKLQDILDRQKLFTYCPTEDKFVLKEFSFYPNLLVKEDKEFLILSSCTMECKILKYKHMQAYGLILTSITGQTYLFFECIGKHLEWRKKFKKYCQQKGFTKKYQIKEKIRASNLFTCMKIKNGLKSQQFIVEIHRDSDLQKNFEKYETLMNEVHILMCVKNSPLLPFKALYQDRNVLFILYNFWSGESLYKIVHSGYKFSEAEKAQILLQIVEFIKKLHLLGLSHCRLTPNNIILLHNNNSFFPIRVALTHFGYKELSYYYWKWLKETVLDQWLPPELGNADFSEDHASQAMVDSYQFGCLLYFLEFYNPQANGSSQLFEEEMKNFKIDYQNMVDLNAEEQVQLKESTVYSSIEPDEICTRSINDLILRLLHPDPGMRFSMRLASKHQWFINNKSKISHQLRKLEVDYSLRTIIELRETSEREIIMSKLHHKIQSQTDYEIDDGLDFLCQDESPVSNKIELLNVQSLFASITQKKDLVG